MTDPLDRTETLAHQTGAQPPAAAVAPGVVLGDRYRLEERVAEGGMAAVWRAHDAVLARPVAIKLLHDHLADDGDFRERFRREAVAAAKLSHPNIVGLYDTGAEGRRVYLVMEYVEGVTLRDVIDDFGRLEPGLAAAIGAKVARGLAFAHERGLVHRDIKPANILLGDDGSVKIADFGIAKAEEAEDITRTGIVLGTAPYVSPEQVVAQALDGRSDQYSLGCVLYEALTGERPFRGDSPVATATARLERAPLPLRSYRPDLPRGLDVAVARAIERDPERRFSTLADFAEALEAFAGDILTGTAEPSPTATRVAGRTTPTEHRPPRPPGASPGRVRRGGKERGVPDESFLHTEGRWLLPVVGLLLTAGLVVWLALATGVLEAPEGIPRLPREGAGDAGDDPPEPALIPAVAVGVFDPFGSGREHDDRLPNLLDGDDTTTWRTERYGNPSFGNLKPGVGFWLDLGEPHDVHEVVLRTTTPGVAFEVRGADALAGSIEEWRLLATVHGAPGLTQVVLEEPTTTRLLLVWLTGDLQAHDGRYAAEFAAVAVRGTPPR
jgi:eukaryotic-like serine/threonine-protein kinase